MAEINEAPIFMNIKSKYILKEIFSNLSQYKLLKIISYNKIIQNRLGKDINDYKEYLNIEIELIPLENKFNKFINIPKNNESYFHIYFNDDN